MAYGRFVVTARVTVAAGPTISAVGSPGNTVSYSNGSGATSKWAPGVPTTFLPGMVLYLDDTTPTGPQQLYQAIGAGNLRPYVQGQDDVGHAALSN